MSVLDPYKPIDEPINGPVLPFKYRNSWEVMLFIDISLRSMEQPIGNICNKLCNKLEQHREGKPDALGEIVPGRTRLALTFHLSELPPPRQYTNPHAVYDGMIYHLSTLFDREDRFENAFRVWKKWRFIDTVAFGIYEIPEEIDRLLCLQEGCTCMDCT
ncbi:uncharacterized protein LDX57_012823 [Aspergillus melleus]|uniref:uncharacterized protein n=1 Tax=Aspergillus melleus TaxID=138277 RepID=UPI001E8D88DB|nr:uncharacterized protein LDX57_012823 [Aspergillus melleus]KAH8435194.1 hypothetical protein LDX57_012823 [Aspergillus melleus]